MSRHSSSIHSRPVAARVALAGGLLLALCAPAFATKSRDELKTEISAKLDAKGVKGATLEVIDATATPAGEGKVVGHCEGGAKQVVYARGAAR